MGNSSRPHRAAEASLAAAQLVLPKRLRQHEHHLAVRHRREAIAALAGDASFACAVLDVAAIPFPDVTFDVAIANHPFADDLWVTEAEPLVAYASSLWETLSLRDTVLLRDTVGWTDAPAADPLRALIRAWIRTDGGVRLTKETGLVVAVKASER